jgi:hypothetical protein
MSIMDTVNVGPIRLVPQSINNDEVNVYLAIVVTREQELEPPRVEGDASLYFPVKTWEAVQEAQANVGR